MKKRVKRIRLPKFKIDKRKMTNTIPLRMRVEVIRLQWQMGQVKIFEDKKMSEELTEYWRRASDVPKEYQRLTDRYVIFHRSNRDDVFRLFLVSTSRIPQVYYALHTDNISKKTRWKDFGFEDKTTLYNKMGRFMDKVGA